MTDPGLPLTTGEGNTAGRIVAEGDVPKVEPTRQYFAELRASLKNGLDASRDLDDSVEDLRYSLASAEAECGRLREQLDAAFSTRDLALILISIGVDMTPEADQFVPQETWDALFSEGLAETRRPLHGEAYSALTSEGHATLAALLAQLPAQSPVSRLPRERPASEADTTGREIVYECPECHALQPEPGRCGRCPCPAVREQEA